MDQAFKWKIRIYFVMPAQSSLSCRTVFAAAHIAGNKSKRATFSRVLSPFTPFRELGPNNPLCETCQSYQKMAEDRCEKKRTLKR